MDLQSDCFDVFPLSLYYKSIRTGIQVGICDEVLTALYTVPFIGEPFEAIKYFIPVGRNIV